MKLNSAIDTPVVLASGVLLTGMGAGVGAGVGVGVVIGGVVEVAVSASSSHEAIAFSSAERRSGIAYSLCC
jgi:hypothetical protein